MSDMFEELLPMSWKGLEFPIRSTDFDLAHDLVQHKFADVDGATVENTGREPLTFNATIPFRRGVVRGKTETWQDLYPTAFVEFVRLAGERTTGALVHPEFGELKCKLASIRGRWVAEGRDGCDIDASWVETNAEGDTFLDIFGRPSPVAQAVGAAIDLDASIPLATLPESDVVHTPDFVDTINAVKTVFDKANVANRKLAGKIDQVIYRIDSLAFSVEKAADPQQWPLRESAERMRSALYDLQKQAFATKKPLRFYTTQAQTTFPSLAITLSRTVSELMTLNPQLVSEVTIPRGTRIRYYADSAVNRSAA